MLVEKIPEKIKALLRNGEGIDVEFKTFIPIPFLNPLDKISSIRIEGAIKGAVEGAFEGATKGVKEKLATLLITINDYEGERVPFFSDLTGIPPKTLEGHIKRLRRKKLIEFSKGEASQVGGYYLTEELKKQIKQ